MNVRDAIRKMKTQWMNRYSEISLPAKAAAWFAICSFLQRGISMIVMPIFTRVLPTEEFGILSTYNSWELILFMVVSLCIYKCTMNLCVKFDDHPDEAFSSLCGLSLLLTMAWMVVGVAFHKQLSTVFRLSETLTVCLFISFVGKTICECWMIYKRYIYEYKPVVTVTWLLAIGSTMLGLFAVLTFGKTAEMRVIASTLVNLIIGIYLYCSVFSAGRRFYQKEVWRFALGFCVPLLPHYLSEFVLQSSDKIMIHYMCGARDVALYSVAYSVGSLLTFLSGAINLSFAPYQYQRMAAREYTLLAKRTNQILLIVSMGLGLLMLFSKEIVLIVGGRKYMESSAVIIPICMGVYFNFQFQLFARVQEFYEQKLTIVIPSVFCAALNVLLNWIFIKIYGYAAAAYTTFLCYFLFCIIHCLFYCKLCKKRLNGSKIYDVRKIMLISSMMIAMGAIIGFLNAFHPLRYAVILILLILMILQRKRAFELLKEMLGK